LTIGVVSHIVDYDIKNEFDPLMLERMKNCMKQLIEKNFIRNLSDEINLTSTMMSLDLRKDVIEKIHKQSLNKMQKDMGDDMNNMIITRKWMGKQMLMKLICHLIMMNLS